MSKNFKGIIVLSTGYTSSRYEKFILDLFQEYKKKFILLHCISAYPAPGNGDEYICNKSL